MSTMSVVSNSSVEVDSDSSNDVSIKDDSTAERKFILRNELYSSLLASALGKTVLNRHLNFKEQGINFNLASLKDNLNALGALKELKDLKGLTVSSVPAFPRNLALHREDHDEKNSFAWSEGGEEGGGGGGGGGGTGGTGTGGTGPATTGGGGLAHWVSVMAEHIHNPHSATGVSVHHQQQSPPQPPYPWNNGLSSDQCAPHDKESDYWGGGRGAKQGYEHFLLQAKMNADHGQLQKGDEQYRGAGGSSSGSPPASLLVVPQPLTVKPSHPSHLNSHLGGPHSHPPRKYQCKMCPQ
ncbi:Uncharacterized protein DBV15_09156, partial [Temnothorax longispinosus]